MVPAFTVNPKAEGAVALSSHPPTSWLTNTTTTDTGINECHVHASGFHWEPNHKCNMTSFEEFTFPQISLTCQPTNGLKLICSSQLHITWEGPTQYCMKIRRPMLILNPSSLPTDAVYPVSSITFFKLKAIKLMSEVHLWPLTSTFKLICTWREMCLRISSLLRITLSSPHSFQCLYQTSKVWNVYSLRTSQTLLNIAIISTLSTLSFFISTRIHKLNLPPHYYFFNLSLNGSSQDTSSINSQQN